MKFRQISKPYVVLALALTVVVVLLVGAAPAPSAPNDSPGADPEGGSSSVNAALEKASRGYIEAKAKLDDSKRKYDQLGARIGELETSVSQSSRELQRIAAAAYVNGGNGMLVLASALGSHSFDDFLERMTFVDHFSRQNVRSIKRAKSERKDLDNSRRQLQEEIKTQQTETDRMAKQKADAEKALARFGGASTGGFFGDLPATADPAPRNPDGTWPRESCSVDDPTSTGCLTPRTLHALNAARAAGFDHYTHCYLVQKSGEHGKGRACDFAAAKGGFEGAAAGAEKAYGDRLAGWFIANSDRLGVLYVIWYLQIWLPGTGWRSYSCGGSPSASHTNHVHLSVQ
ncbi:MAG: coiled-coil domain-containing protein [Terriglobales bacterium]